MEGTEVSIPKLRFAANLSFLFPEATSLIEKYQKATDAGFKGVECGGDIYEYPILDLVKAKEHSKQKQILINSFTGNSNGLACIPQRFDEFKQCLELSIQYCKALNCHKLHIMAGQYPEQVEITEEMKSSYRETFIENVRYASSRLELENITGLIEPISTIPNYFLERTDQALDLLREIACPNILLQLDVYHHQKTQGNITETISENLSILGHIQISQVPGRNEPDSNGELNYTYILNHLLNIGYEGWIGCEYVPSGNKTSLRWLEPYLEQSITNL